MSPLAILSVVIVLVLPVPGSQLYGAKRGRPQYSSLIPFPRVGKRGGPWDGLVDAASPRGLSMSDGRRGPSAEPLSWQPAEPRPLLTLLPRIGRSDREKEDGSVALLEG